MSTSPPNPSGWLESLRHIGESLAALVHIRVELFTVEWQEERLRLVNLLIWLSVATAVCAAGIFMAMMVLAVWLWRVAGFPGILSVTGVTLLVGAAMLFRLQRKLRASPPPFAQTVEEIRKDTECLRRN